MVRGAHLERHFAVSAKIDRLMVAFIARASSLDFTGPAKGLVSNRAGCAHNPTASVSRCAARPHDSPGGANKTSALRLMPGSGGAATVENRWAASSQGR